MVWLAGDWRVRLLLLVTALCLYCMVSTLISVTRLDARTLADRRYSLGRNV